MSSSTVKTAISLEGDLLREAQALARRMNVSRSRLFATAMEEFLERRRNRELLRAINAAHGRVEEPAEARLRGARQRHHREALRGEW
jgi:metal-responsive CopG/Arc/MetJ family transcriptional regulator